MTTEYPIPRFHFQVDWGGSKLSFTEVTGLVMEREKIEYRHSDSKNFSKGADTIFLMTDGSPNMGKFADPELILHEVKELNRTRKITIHTIGVGEGHNAPFLRSLAAQNNGQYLAR